MYVQSAEELHSFFQPRRVSVMNPANMTGLQIMHAFAQGLIPAPSITKTMPMSVSVVEEKRVVFLATANQSHTNPLGGVHGGFAACWIRSRVAQPIRCLRLAKATARLS
jgi:hypothetical protein